MTMNYQSLLLDYTLLDEKVYNAICGILNHLKIEKVIFDESEQFQLTGAPDEVVCLVKFETGEPNMRYLVLETIMGTPDFIEIEGGEYKYSLTDDCISILDNLSILHVLENKFFPGIPVKLMETAPYEPYDQEVSGE